MSLEQTTPVPNRLFDFDLLTLKEVELKVLLVVIRKTFGWVDEKNHRQRKQIARIPITGFVVNTGCSKRGISAAIDALVLKRLILVYDENGSVLTTSDQRKGKYYLYFSPNFRHAPMNRALSPTNAKFALKPVQNLPYTIKEKSQKKEFSDFRADSALRPFHITRYLSQYTV